jgi:transporter family protein
LPSYIWLALASTLLIGLADFAYGSAVRKGVTAGTMTCSQASFVLPATAIWAAVEGEYVWTAANYLGAAAALFIFTGFWAFMRSVSLGEAGVSTPIYRIGFVVTALVAILFLGEELTVPKAAGFLLAGGAIFLLSEIRFSGAGAARLKKASIAWAIVAMVSVGFVNVVYKLGMAGGVAPSMFLHSQAIFFVWIAFPYAYFVQGGPRFSRQGWTHSLTSGVSLTVGIISLLAALRRGEASVVVPISQLSFVVSVLLATFWMRERFTVRKGLGLLLAAGTVAAFSAA